MARGKKYLVLPADLDDLDDLDDLAGPAAKTLPNNFDTSCENVRKVLY
jgi:hypothetical protein